MSSCVHWFWLRLQNTSAVFSSFSLSPPLDTLELPVVGLYFCVQELNWHIREEISPAGIQPGKSPPSLSLSPHSPSDSTTHTLKHWAVRNSPSILPKTNFHATAEKPTRKILVEWMIDCDYLLARLQTGPCSWGEVALQQTTDGHHCACSPPLVWFGPG
jgi:hypothetical protein